MKEFKSIHVDLEKGIYRLNGEPMEHVKELNLILDSESWSLRINKDEWFDEGSRHANKTPIETSKALRGVGMSLGTKVSTTDIGERTKYLECITYYEWKKISTAVNRYFDEQIRESQKKMKLTESKRVNQLIYSQFG